MIRNLGERLRIGFGHREADGTRLEPEAQPVIREIASEATVALGHGPMDGITNPTATLPSKITEGMSAAGAADQFSRICGNCAHHRLDLWKEERKRMESTHEGREQLNRLRGELLGRGAVEVPSLINGDEFADVERALGAFGCCTALSEATGEPQFTLPEAFCPPDFDGFTPRNGARRAVDGIRDYVLKLASKK